MLVPGLIIPSSTKDPKGILGLDLLFSNVSKKHSSITLALLILLSALFHATWSAIIKSSSNPLSLEYALNNFNKLKSNSKRKIILLGDMLELGKFSKKLHLEAAEIVNNTDINRVYVYSSCAFYYVFNSQIFFLIHSLYLYLHILIKI